jgi:membrane protein YqaA with SNARE-associated domain
MESWISAHLSGLLAILALPKFGLSTLFIVSFVSATLLPMGSEPAVIGLVELNPDLFWPAILVATVGNTLGGGVTWCMGAGAKQAYSLVQDHPPSSAQGRAVRWLQRFGPKACLLSWLPIVGDPLCAVAGWLKLPFIPCLAYMAIGKFARYLTMTGLWFVGVRLTMG